MQRATGGGTNAVVARFYRHDDPGRKPQSGAIGDRSAALRRDRGGGCAVQAGRARGCGDGTPHRGYSGPRDRDAVRPQHQSARAIGVTPFYGAEFSDSCLSGMPGRLANSSTNCRTSCRFSTGSIRKLRTNRSPWASSGHCCEGSMPQCQAIGKNMQWRCCRLRRTFAWERSCSSRPARSARLSTWGTLADLNLNTRSAGIHLG